MHIDDDKMNKLDLVIKFKLYDVSNDIVESELVIANHHTMKVTYSHEKIDYIENFGLMILFIC